MPVAINQLKVRPKHKVINLINPQDIIQLSAYKNNTIKQLINAVIPLSPFLISLHEYPKDDQ